VVHDPHALAPAAARLGGGARRSGRAALAVLGAVLEEEDRVAIVVQGRFRGEPGVAALTAGKVVLVNDRQWKPDVTVFAVEAGLAVNGWQDERSAALTFVASDRHETIERIGDRALAIELAQRLRQQLGVEPFAGPPPVPTGGPIPGPGPTPPPPYAPAPPPPPPPA
jgi:hypothetical protein